MKKIQITKWNRRDQVLFIERLELYVSAGLSINRALIIGLENVKKKKVHIINTIIKNIEAGEKLSYALNIIGLSKSVSGLIEHGESSGQLAKALTTGRLLMEREDELFKKCITAMTYPFVIGIFTSLLTLGLIRGVMPQIIPMLKSLNVKLPLLTKIVIFISEGLLTYGIYGIAITLISIIIFIILYKKFIRLRKLSHNILIRIPIVGSLIYQYSLTVFLHAYGSLVEAGLPIARSYANVVQTISLLPLRLKLESKIESIDRGVSVSDSFIFWGIPAYISPLLKAGEASGTLGLSITRAASILDKDIEHSLKRLTSLIEPVMMAGMGCIVGAIALSIMLPIYDISKVLQH